MPSFAYQAIDFRGAKQKGIIDAASSDAAMAKLEQSGLTPISVVLGKRSLPWWQRDIKLFGSSTYKPADILIFFESLSTGLDAQLPLSRALQICGDSVHTPQMTLFVEQVSEAVSGGATLNAAIEKEAPDFPDRLLKAIALGETSNNLQSVVAETVVSLRNEAKMYKEVQQALTYPIILIAVSAIVIGILVFYLTPTLMPVFDNAGTSAPFVIRSMMSIRVAFIDNIPVVLVSPLICILGLFAFGPKLMRLCNPLFAKLPLLKTYIRQRDTLQLLRTMYLMLSGGSTLLNALKTSQDSALNPPMRSMLSEAIIKIEAGDTLRETVLQSKLIERTTASVLATGEEADRLTQVLAPTIARLETQTSQTVSQSVKLLTPILTLFLGIFVGTIILSTVSAIMDLNDAVL